MLNAEAIGFVWEPFRQPALKGCHRAEFLLRVSSEIYDGFFNSPVGYRAQYAESAENGEQKNRELLDSIRTKLLACAQSVSDTPIEDVEQSINGIGAKVWIDESEVESHYYDDTPEIEFYRWEHNQPDGPGLRAPQGSRLVVCGGWIDGSGCERMNPYKRTRSKDLYEVGFS